MPCMFTRRKPSKAYADVTGYACSALAKAASATGIGTKATAPGQRVVGTYNVVDNDALLIVGNGESDTNRSNAFAVYKDGSIKLDSRFALPYMLDISTQVWALGGFMAWFLPDNPAGFAPKVSAIAQDMINVIESELSAPLYLKYKYTDANGYIDQRTMPCTIIKESHIDSAEDATISTFYVYFNFTGYDTYCIRIIRKWYNDNHVDYNWSTITTPHAEYPEGTSWIIDMDAIETANEG